jgi:SWI/SNF-related matrix-associated actin-dependent regulator of chromatin subfamily A protein 2/4
MFNDNASDIDRQKKLEELIRQGNEDEDEPDEECETEIPNDTQINEMLARSPEEFELFQKMDQEMYDREGKEARMAMIMEKRPGLKDYSRFNYRLIQDWEVPEWI